MAKKGKKNKTEVVQAEKTETKSKRKSDDRPLFTWPFGRLNLILFLVGFVTIVMGYIIMATGEVDSFASVTLAPLVLIVGYLVLIPLAILWPDKKAGVKEEI